MKDIRILLTIKNSPWGKILRQNAPNITPHIINFPLGAASKDEFINNQLFDGADYKVLFDNLEEGSFRLPKDIKNIILPVNREEMAKVLGVENATTDKMFNKDYAIVRYTNELDNHVYLFYNLTDGGRYTGTGSVFEYKAFLDVSFTYITNIKELFENKNILIKRAMTDRFYFDDSDDIQFDFNDESVLHNPEEIGEAINKLVPKFTSTGKMYYIDENESDATNRNRVDTAFSKLQWAIFYIHKDNERLISSGGVRPLLKIKNIDGSGDIEMPYSVLIAPITDNFTLKISGEDLEYSATYLYEYFTGAGDVGGDSGTLLKVQITSMNPFLERSTISINGELGLGTTGPQGNPGEFQFAEFLDDLWTGTNQIGSMSASNTTDNAIKYMFLKYAVGGEVGGTGDMYPQNFTNNIDVNFQPAQPFNKENEPKLSCFPFKAWILNGLNNQHTIQPNLIYNDQLNLKAVPTFNPEIYTSYFYPHNCGIYRQSEESLNNGMVCITSGNFSLPWSVDQWQLYLAQNPVSATLGLAAKAAAVVGAAATLNPLAIVASSSVFAKELVNRGDIKGRRDELKETGNFLISAVSNRRIERLITESELIESDKNVVADFFYKFGYSYNKMWLFTTLLETRYYFNYIEAIDTFNIIKAQLSAPTKQELAQMFADGVTIWHYRDSETWKGIINYQYENFEIALQKTKEN